MSRPLAIYWTLFYQFYLIFKLTDPYPANEQIESVTKYFELSEPYPANEHVICT